MRKFRGLVATLATLAAAACQGGESPAGNEAIPTAPTNETNVAEAMPLPDPALDRAAFLGAMASAASAYTAGSDDGRVQSALEGRRFAIRIRFGCDGPTPDRTTALGWTKGGDGKSFDIFAKPDLSLDDEPLKGIADQTIEAVEGFWIPRPWETSGTCPAPDSNEDEAALPAPQLVGIAQYFTTNDSRVGRRSGRPYVATRRIDLPSELPDAGLTLLLEGRFEPWPNGRVIRCTGSGRNRQPSCIASAHLDRAAFIMPGEDSIIAEWRD